MCVCVYLRKNRRMNLSMQTRIYPSSPTRVLPQLLVGLAVPPEADLGLHHAPALDYWCWNCGWFVRWCW